MGISKLDKASIIAIKDCMGAKKNEKILVVTDTNKKEIGYNLYNNAIKLGYQALYIEMPPWEMHGQEPPEYIADIMQKFDVVFCPTTKSLTHTDARRNASAKGVRVATFPGITEDVMIRGLSANYKKISALTLKLKRIMEKVKTVHIIAPSGTDITMDIRGRKVIPSKGLFHKKGESGNLPTGETYVAPIEGTTNGVFVVDGSMSGIGVLGTEKIRIEVKNGLAVKIQGKEKAKKLSSIIKKYGKNAQNIAEFGIGTNDKAKLSGNLLEDEKVLGTVHIALGDNKSMGGLVNAPIHLDGLIKSPTVYFDKKMIMKSGKLLI
ncbi:MAG: aminopeptidase [Ignavibacteriales bacterium]|nr:aminopeptidase [Ignavibacteriales bacterium]